MPDRPLVEDWATDWDYNGPQYHQNAPEVWRELHQHCPVAHTDRFHGAWLVVRAADVSAIAHDTALFSSREPNLYDDPPERLMVFPPISMDPPEHVGYRRAWLPRFTPKEVHKLVPSTEAACHLLIDRFIDAGEADAAVDYAQHVPGLVTLNMFGLADADADQFRRWIHDIIEAGFEDVEQSRISTLELLAYFREHLDQRRRGGGDDLIAWIAHAEVDGEPIHERMQAAMLFLLLIGGIDTTWSVLGAALLHLATHPEDQARLRNEPGLLETAVEEFVRMYASAEIGRVVTADGEVSGCPVSAGDHVWLSFPAACRSPACSPIPTASSSSAERTGTWRSGRGSPAPRLEPRPHGAEGRTERLDGSCAALPVPEGATIEYSTGGNVRGPWQVPVAC